MRRSEPTTFLRAKNPGRRDSHPHFPVVNVGRKAWSYSNHYDVSNRSQGNPNAGRRDAQDSTRMALEKVVGTLFRLGTLWHLRNRTDKRSQLGQAQLRGSHDEGETEAVCLVHKLVAPIENNVHLKLRFLIPAKLLIPMIIQSSLWLASPPWFIFQMLRTRWCLVGPHRAALPNVVCARIVALPAFLSTGHWSFGVWIPSPCPTMDCVCRRAVGDVKAFFAWFVPIPSCL